MSSPWMHTLFFASAPTPPARHEGSALKKSQRLPLLVFMPRSINVPAPGFAIPLPTLSMEIAARKALFGAGRRHASTVSAQEQAAWRPIHLHPKCRQLPEYHGQRPRRQRFRAPAAATMGQAGAAPVLDPQALQRAELGARVLRHLAGIDQVMKRMRARRQDPAHAGRACC